MPKTGIKLVGAPDAAIVSPAPKNPPVQVLGFNVSDSVINDIVKFARGDKEAVQITFGYEKKLRFGTNEGTVVLEHQPHRQELYRAPDPSTRELQFVGLVNHKMSVKSIRSGNVDAKDAFLAIQQKMEAIQQQKNARTTVFTSALVAVPGKRSAPAASKASTAFLNREKAKIQSRNQMMGLVPASRPVARPALSAASPPSGPLANPMQASPRLVPQDDRTRRQRAARVPLLHLLAVHTCSERHLARKMKLAFEDFEVVLEKYARKDDYGDWKLSDRAYKELDLWKFRYRRDDQRERAIRNAISAYDRLRLSRTDKLWQMLLPEHDRGKGICLSRLDLRNGPLAPTTSTTTMWGPPPPPSSRQPTRQSSPAVVGAARDSDRTASDGGQVHSSADERAGSAAASAALPRAGPSKRQQELEKRLFSKKKQRTQEEPARPPKRAAEPSESEGREAKRAKVAPAKKAAATTKKASAKNAPASGKARGPPKSSEFVHSSSEEDEEVDKPAAAAGQPASQASARPAAPSKPTAPRPLDGLGAAPKRKGRGDEEEAEGAREPPRDTKRRRRPSGEAPSPAPAPAPTPASALASVRPARATPAPPSQQQRAPRSSASTPAATPSLTSDSRSPASPPDAAAAAASATAAAVPGVMALSRKFKEVYARYERLHREVSAMESPPQEKVDKVLRMHEWLAATKRDIHARSGEVSRC